MNVQNFMILAHYKLHKITNEQQLSEMHR